MKRSFVVLLGFVLVAGVFPASAQVIPSATGRRLVINAGGEGSYLFQPDYINTLVASRAGPHLFGIGAWVDADFTRWVQIEAEGRWLRWNQLGDVDQNTYMIGPRVPVHTWRGLTPYGKFLFGWGSGDFLDGRTTTWAYGGGVDYRLGRRFTVRCVDFEYQEWDVDPTLHPYGFSSGLSYKVF